jgi:hypothetical protein
MDNRPTCSSETLDRCSEGPRRIVAGGPRGAVLEYEIARLPDGRYAMRYDYSFPGHSGGGSCWTEYRTREECLAAFRAFALDLCAAGRGRSETHRRAACVLRDVLDPGDLFGFQEPDPVPRPEWLPERTAFAVDQMALQQSWALLDVVRGGDYRPISPAKDGSFFAIPLPWDG